MQGLWKNKYSIFIKDKKNILKKVSNNFEIGGLKENCYTRKAYKEVKKSKTIEFETKLFLLKFPVELDKKFIKKNCLDCQFNYLNKTNEKEPYYDYEKEKISYEKAKYKYCFLNYFEFQARNYKDMECFKTNKLEFKFSYQKMRMINYEGEYYFLSNENSILKLPSYVIVVKEIKDKRKSKKIKIKFNSLRLPKPYHSYISNEKIFLYKKKITKQELKRLKRRNERYYDYEEEYLIKNRNKIKQDLKKIKKDINEYDNISFVEKNKKIWYY